MPPMAGLKSKMLSIQKVAFLLSTLPPLSFIWTSYSQSIDPWSKRIIQIFDTLCIKYKAWPGPFSAVNNLYMFDCSIFSLYWQKIQYISLIFIALQVAVWTLLRHDFMLIQSYFGILTLFLWTWMNHVRLCMNNL